MSGAEPVGERKPRGDARPRLRLSDTRADRVVGMAGLAGLGVSWALVGLSWLNLPETVPWHFGFSGAPDSWGPRWGVLLVPAVSSLLFAGLSLLRRFPHTFNYPTPIAEDNAERQYTIARSLVQWLKLLIAWSFAVVDWSIVRAALNSEATLPPLFVLAVVFSFFIVVAVYLIRASGGGRGGTA